MFDFFYYKTRMKINPDQQPVETCGYFQCPQGSLEDLGEDLFHLVVDA